jgi:polyisoprenoid-binding protein YceI
MSSLIVGLLSMTSLVACAPAGDDSPSATETAAGVITEELPELEPAPAGASTYTVAPTGNEVRYRVREQLAGVDFPNDAIGKTSNITGQIVIEDDGTVVSNASRFVVDAASIASDRDRRDNYVRGRTLTVEQHPTIVLVPTELRGLSMPAGAGSDTFQIVGDLTVRGVTRPTTWNATAQFRDGGVTGSAVTRFAFADFQMEKPRVRSVLSVADTIALEYDFKLVRDNVTSP